MISGRDDYLSIVGATIDARTFDRLRTGELADEEIEALAENGEIRSRFCFEVLLQSAVPDMRSEAALEPASAPQRDLYFFWDTDPPPQDVINTLASWDRLPDGFSRALFNDAAAQAFIAAHFSDTQVTAYQWCPHPAMRSDYFRLCYALRRGGVYIDADDGYKGGLESQLHPAADLALHPLVWDFAAARNVPAEEWRLAGGMRTQWGYYFNNTPLIARPDSIAVGKALDRATRLIAHLGAHGGIPDIHDATGPGSMTIGLFWQALMVAAGRQQSQTFRPLSGWSDVAYPQPLTYKGDARNWRSYAEPVPGGRRLP